ncbi:MAG: ferredoxin [Acidimicrobiia bacterium]|nr:ferredoxin [Acidimicrobiia bacterium]
MRITLDDEKCQGHGRCYALAPELFDTDDEGYAVLRVTAADGALGPDQESPARLAANNCPEFAIEVHPT